MKKYLLRFIALLVCLCLILSGCGSSPDQSNNASQEEATQAESEACKAEPKPSAIEEVSMLSIDTDTIGKSTALAAAKKLLEMKIAKMIQFEIATPPQKARNKGFRHYRMCQKPLFFCHKIGEQNIGVHI